ncbi:hypothetical protein Hte_007692 [Hypoxylon texense]
MAAEDVTLDSSAEASSDVENSGSERSEPWLESILAVTGAFLWQSGDSIPWNGDDPGATMISDDPSDKAQAITAQSLENLNALINGLQMVVNSSDETPEMIDVLDQLLICYGCRYAVSGDIEDLEEGILYGLKAASCIYEDDSETASILLNLGTMLGKRYDVTRLTEDLDEAISYTSRAISASVELPDVASRKSSLGFLLCRRFDATQSQSDLDNAILTLRSALPTLPDSQPGYCKAIRNTLLRLAWTKLERDSNNDYFETILEELANKDLDAEGWLESWKRHHQTIDLQSFLESTTFQRVSGHETDEDSDGQEAEVQSDKTSDDDWQRALLQQLTSETEQKVRLKTQSGDEAWFLETRGERLVESHVQFPRLPQLLIFNPKISTVENYPIDSPEDLRRHIDRTMGAEKEFDEADDEIAALQDCWTFTSDNLFTEKLFQGVAVEDVVPKPDVSDSPRLCHRCSNLDILSPELEILVSLPDQYNPPETWPWESPAGVQVGYPVLPAAGSGAYFQLMRDWLRICDSDHDCWKGPDSFLPSRLLDVEREGEDGSSLRLHISSQGERGRYLALSHCWGALEQTVKDRYCTYRCNIRNKCKEISWPDLPKTFQDAVTVARGLGIRYLWIDSICIIQPHPGCSADCARLQDWNSEAGKMERYYSQAYATIAATSAPDSTAGFLHPRPAAEFVRAGTSPGGAPLYICESIDNFRDDVEGGLLNKRAWVLQERALSRRTIHLTAAQNYWECGQAIRCETLTKLSNPQASFWSDAQFPDSILSYTKSNRFRLFQHLFTTYCNLGIAYPTDRSHAIAGLLERLTESINSKQRYGILDRFLHRSLLWRRRRNGAKLTRIDYPPGQAVPSWSWMALHGQIEYMDIPPYKVEWSDAILFFPADEDQDGGSDVHSQASGGSGPRESGKAFRALSRRFASPGTKDFEIAWDEAVDSAEQAANVSTQNLRCVVLGRVGSPGEEQEHFALVVEPSGEAGLFKRVGVASVQRRHVLFDKPGEEIWVV